MAVNSQPDYTTQARIIKALAHATRLFIVDELSRGERCVCELTDMIGVEMPTVSRHLSQLRNAGVVAREKRGSQVFYRLRASGVLDFFKSLENLQTNGFGRCIWPPVRRTDSPETAPMARRRRKVL